MAHHWRVDAWGNHDGAAGDLFGAVLHWVVDLELTDMTNKEYEDARRLQMNGLAKPVGKYSIKHPILAAAMIFYVIGFLIGYVVGKI